MVRSPRVKSTSQVKGRVKMESKHIHFHMQIIKRSEGRNAIACASYRAAVALYDQRIGQHFDYSKSNKSFIAHSEIMAPSNTPPILLERQSLWQQVEWMEKRRDAQLCREFDAALPMQLNKAQQVALMQEFCRTAFTDKGMICDINMHDKEGNPHFHTMITMRDIEPDAEFGFGKKNRTWNDKALVTQWREQFTTCINKHQERAGSPVRYACDTLEAQAIDRVAQIHVGPAAVAMDERDGVSWRMEANNNIIDFNQAAAKLKASKAAAAKADNEKEEQEKIDAAHAEALAMEEQRRQSLQHFIRLVDKFDRKWDKHSQWIAMKDRAMTVPEVESHWRSTGSILRESIRQVVQSIRTAIADYLHDYGRDLHTDAWSDRDSGPSGASNGSDDNIEINGP